MTVNTSNLNMNKLAAGLSLAIALIGVGSHAAARGVRVANIAAVTSCADDNSPGTLRQVVANATSGAQIDLSGLSCTNNEITLTQGEIVIAQDLVLFGAPGAALTITSDMGRVLRSTSSNLSINNLTISGGSVNTKTGDAEGGCILAAGNVFLSGSVVSDCAAFSRNSSARGGAISAISVSLVNSRISGSSAISTGYYELARGGGVYAASLSCTDSTLSGNLVSGDSSNGYGQGGGALILGGAASLSRCTVNSNKAGEGGGIKQIVFPGWSQVTRNPPLQSPVTSIQNSTISGNTATFASAGFEVFCTDCTPQPVQILNSTIAFNSSPLSYGDGINTNGSVDAQSSIFANNGSEDGSPFADVFATGLTGADNLLMATNVKPARGVVTLSADPMLLPLANNGGATWTHSLQPSSPVMLAGNNSALFVTDQRGNGFSRTDNGLVDIGAFQHSQPVTAPALKQPPTRGH
jgi:hypothetical protein